MTLFLIVFSWLTNHRLPLKPKVVKFPILRDFVKSHLQSFTNTLNLLYSLTDRISLVLIPQRNFFFFVL